MATVTFTFPHNVVVSTIDTATYTFIPAKGEKGAQGDTGPAGYTPVRGTDYWTESDVSAIESDIESMVETKMQSFASVTGTTLVFGFTGVT